MAQPTSPAGQVQTGTEAHGGHEAGFPPFKTETFGTQLIWLAICFGLLYVCVSRLILPRLSGIKANREAVISSNLAEAEASRKKAEEAGIAYEAALKQARTNAQKTAQEARDRLNAQSNARRKAVDAELATKLASAEARIETRKKEAMSHVEAIAADAASAIVAKLAGLNPSADQVSKALRAE